MKEYLKTKQLNIFKRLVAKKEESSHVPQGLLNNKLSAISISIKICKRNLVKKGIPGLKLSSIG